MDAPKARAWSALRGEQNGHRDGLGKFVLEVPAGGIAFVGEEGMDTLAGLRGVDLVDVVFGFVAFFADGEDAVGRDGFVRIGGGGVASAEEDRDGVPEIDEENEKEKRESDAFEDGAHGL